MTQPFRSRLAAQRCRALAALAGSMLLAIPAASAAEPLMPQQVLHGHTCPPEIGAQSPAIAVVTPADHPIPVHMKVLGENDHGSAGALMADRSAQATGRWVAGGLLMGAGLADAMQRTGERMSSPAVHVDIGPFAAPVGGLILIASLATAPFALVAGAVRGASEAADYSRRHDAARREVEGALRVGELESQLAHAVGRTLRGAANLPVVLVDRTRVDRGALLAECGAVAVLELEVERIDFESPSVREFVARPTLTANYRLSEPHTASAPHRGTIQVRGRYTKFDDIARHGAGEVANELAAGMDGLATRIFAALPETVAWQKPHNLKLATVSVQAAARDDLREPLRIHPELYRPSGSTRLAMARAPEAGR
jgi:hypothetical protein